MTTKLARADTIESRVEFEAGPAANNPGPRAVLRRHAPSATRQRTLEATGSTAGLVPFSKRSSSAALVLYPIVPSRSNPLAGARQETRRSVAEHANDHLPGVQARALLYSAPTGASSRASTRPDSRPSPGSRSRGGPMADKKAAKRRRRENKEAREKAKAERTGPSPAQQAEAVRNIEAEDPRHAERRTGLDGSVGGDSASNSRPSQ